MKKIWSQNIEYSKKLKEIIIKNSADWGFDKTEDSYRNSKEGWEISEYDK